MADGARQFCTFHLDDHLFGVDVLDVQEVIRYQAMTYVPLAPNVVEGLINLRGQIVTAVDLRTRLDLPARPEGQLPMNVVVRTDDGPVSFLVDKIGDVLDVSDDDYEHVPDTLHGVSAELLHGVYKLQHGLLLVLDTGRAADIGLATTAAD
jgi:purine-binding chemotaxis protein CheW